MNYEDKTNRWISIEVAKRLGKRVSTVTEFHEGDGCVVYPHNNQINFDPCNNPSDAWPIIVKSNIGVNPAQVRSSRQHRGNWYADKGLGLELVFDDNPLRAAMICFLKMKDA